MIYAYQCTKCRLRVDSTRRADHLDLCPECLIGLLQRKWQVSIKDTMPEHFNQTTQTHVSSMRQFTDDLKRNGEAYSERTGIEVNYKPKDWADLAAEAP